MTSPCQESVGLLWTAFGALGGIVFYSRFYLQWLVSERTGKSVMPVGFWYMSLVGSLMLFPYAVATRSPVGTLSQCFNLVVYARNLSFIWQRRHALSPGARYLIHAVTLIGAVVSVLLTAHVWVGAYRLTQSAAGSGDSRTWAWVGMGLAGQMLFAGRFALQWAVSEKRGESTVPASFWHLSLLAATLQAASFAKLEEWVFAVGTAATVVIYLRNIMLLRQSQTETP